MTSHIFLGCNATQNGLEEERRWPWYDDPLTHQRSRDPKRNPGTFAGNSRHIFDHAFLPICSLFPFLISPSTWLLTLTWRVYSKKARIIGAGWWRLSALPKITSFSSVVSNGNFCAPDLCLGYNPNVQIRLLTSNREKRRTRWSRRTDLLSRLGGPQCMCFVWKFWHHFMINNLRKPGKIWQASSRAGGRLWTGGGLCRSDKGDKSQVAVHIFLSHGWAHSSWVGHYGDCPCWHACLVHPTTKWN